MLLNWLTGLFVDRPFVISNGDATNLTVVELVEGVGEVRLELEGEATFAVVEGEGLNVGTFDLVALVQPPAGGKYRWLRYRQPCLATKFGFWSLDPATGDAAYGDQAANCPTLTIPRKGWRQLAMVAHSRMPRDCVDEFHAHALGVIGLPRSGLVRTANPDFQGEYDQVTAALERYEELVAAPVKIIEAAGVVAAAFGEMHETHHRDS